MAGGGDKNVISNQAEADQQLIKLDETNADGRNLLSFYEGTSTMILGLAGTDLVVQNFKIHEEYLKEIFTRVVPLPATGVIYNSVKVIRTDASGNPITATPRTEGRDITFKPGEGDLTSTNKGGINRGFLGRKCRIPIPKSAGLKLKRFFKLKGSAGNPRINAWIMFPRMASNMSIALWIATHIDNTYLSDMGTFYTERGSKISFDPTKYNTNDPVALGKLIGSFTTRYKNRLSGVKAV